jgi:hypothetical protein
MTDQSGLGGIAPPGPPCMPFRICNLTEKTLAGFNALSGDRYVYGLGERVLFSKREHFGGSPDGRLLAWLVT